MGNIHLLEKSVYELIAAGEVIERPSSVVKEMIENSVDAGASSITVEIKNGGRTYIRITDNGCGMTKEDIPLAFVRHATSKILEKDDLVSISTLGFRGEALASVCAVSKVEVMTKRREDELGSHYVIEGGEELELDSIGCPDGTTFVIRDLFFNVPARLKFLKKDVSEGNAIASVVQKLALSHPEISFKFIRDNKTELITSGDGKLLSVIYAVFGREFHSSCIPVDYSYNGISVSGYVTKPLSAKANRAFQNFFVNSRYVKSVTCMVALEEAYRNQIMTGKFPGCVLSIGINPSNIDVNVHPAKIEIRFSEEKSVYDAVYFAVKNALMSFDTPTEAVFDEKKPKTLSYQEIYSKPAEPDNSVQLMFSSTRKSITFSEDSPKQTVNRAEPVVEAAVQRETVSFEEPQVKAQPVNADPAPSASISEPVISDKFKYINKESFVKTEKTDEPAIVADTSDKPLVKVIGELFKTYIVCECGEDMYLIDKHAAHERHNFEKIKSGAESLDMQTLITPVDVVMSYEGYDAIRDNPEICKRLGFGIELLDAPNISLYGVPVLIGDEDPADLLTRFSDSLASGKIASGSELFDDLFHSIACKASVKANSITDKIELEELTKLIFEEDIRYCPHGRPVLIKLSKYEIEKMFKRIV